MAGARDANLHVFGRLSGGATEPLRRSLRLWIILGRLDTWPAAGEIGDQDSRHRAYQPSAARNRIYEGDADARGEEGEHDRKRQEPVQPCVEPLQLGRLKLHRPDVVTVLCKTGDNYGARR